MIPLKLTIKNFLCYRGDVPTLDLEGVNVACLCGDNGHGKSALLDAITWALWGNARGSRRRGRTQDELIHYSENEMLVDLEFAVQEQRYRVVRRHNRGRNRSGASDLQLMVSAGDGFRPITGDSINQTQRSIEELIGLDYETFINSAFLLQGRADEFTNRTPDKRKEVLANVMGLDTYDRLMERARERASQRQRDLQATEVRIEGLEREVGTLEECQSALDEVRQSLQQTQDRLSETRQQRESCRRQVEELHRLRDEARSLQEQLPKLESDRGRLQGQVQQHQRRIDEYEALLADRSAIEKGFEELQAARKLSEELSAAQSRYSALAQERESVRGRVRAEEARLSEQVRQLETYISGQLVPRAESSGSLERELTGLRTRMDELTREEELLARDRERLRETSEQAGQLRGDLERHEREGHDLRTRLELLEQSPQDARCPLCDSLLGESEFQHLLESHHTDIEAKRSLYRETQSRLKSLEEEQAALQRDLDAREKTLRREQQTAQSRLGGLERQIEEARKASRELEESRTRLTQATARLKAEDFAAEDRARLATLDAEMAGLAYDPAQHQETQRAMAGLQPFEERRRLLTEAESRLPQERESQATTRQMVERLQQDIDTATTRVQETGKALEDLPTREEELRKAEAEVQGLESEERVLLGREGELAGRLNRIRQQEQELRSLRRERRALAEEVDAFGELAQAFGRRGIQAVLIESAIPELEQQANDLLGRMTENRMHLKLETQREARSGKGEPIETLDIHISDELGTRSYEMYSGGEAFRINLALRIALSRILAQRKGAPMPVLFIDEGFGTQDNAGRERIIEVIRAIEPLFEKILVITHLDEVKEAFPVRIEVQKTDGAATFVVT